MIHSDYSFQRISQPIVGKMSWKGREQKEKGLSEVGAMVA